MTAPLSCPSAQPDMDEAQVLGVVERDGDGAGLAYVNGRVPVTPELLEATGEVPPTLVMRFAAPCAENRCTHFDGTDCQLVKRITDGFAPQVDKLPACAIRKTCRWYSQEGDVACHRCPQVVTRIEQADPKLLEIAGLPD